MTNQTSIKYISSLLDNPGTMTEGDQSSIALFRQTFPYFVPARYLIALEGHKKKAYTPQMLSAMQPYMGDWILFCDFLKNGTTAAGDGATVNKVVDKKMADINRSMRDMDLPTSPVITAQTEAPEAVVVVETIVQPEPPPVIAPAIAEATPVTKPEPPSISLPGETKAATPAEPAVNADNIVPVLENAGFVVMEPSFIDDIINTPLAAPVPEIIVPELVPAPPETVAPVAEETTTWPQDVVTEVAVPPIAAEHPAPEVVVEPLLSIPVPLPVIIDEAAPVIPAPPAATVEPIHWPQDTDTVSAVPSFIESIRASLPADTPAENPPPVSPPVPADDTLPVVAETRADMEDVLPVQVETTVPPVFKDTVEESAFAKAWAEMESQEPEPATAIPAPAETEIEEAVEIVNDTSDPVEASAVKSEPDPLIFPIYTRDYFLQQGEKISEEIPLEINELKDTDTMSEEDKSLMVVMSFSEWLLHFKNSAEKQKEETKDQKALKTMWQKEKLAAAMEEENEEIPENVFEMAVNSISKEDGLVSETLAEIYIKQGKYDKAIEMYRKLSLRNPQKNVYFARKIEEALKDKQS